MNPTITVLLASASFVLAVAAVLDFARRELTKKRCDYRMGQALRRVILEPSGIQMGSRSRAVEWQSCETTSARCS